MKNRGRDESETWPVGLYAPGDYWCICSFCKKSFMGDKRSKECPDCVIQFQLKQYEEMKLALTYASVVVDQVANDEQVEPNSLATAWIYINEVLGTPLAPNETEKD